jgi:16S rRNA (cytidine1402-2'-O)-methyltransferase
MVKNSARTRGILYIVATPIGNRDDISFRALQTLQSVDFILAEDTRHSAQLLNLFGIHKPLLSLHNHNEAHKTEQIIRALELGQSFALISDAGTPLISDPGFPLVRLAREKQLQIVPIPGACALIAALSAAGVACDSFTFVGFLPAKQVARRAKLESLRSSENTVVFYESTHRVMDCIDDLSEIYGQNYELVIAKELTKTFECFIGDKIKNIREWFHKDSARIKGEFVFIIPAKPVEQQDNKKDLKILSILINELPLKQAVKIASLLTEKNKNELYKLALQLKK